MTPTEKLKLAQRVTALVDAALDGDPSAKTIGAEVLFLALKARVSMEQIRLTAAGGGSTAAGYSSL